jgi:hypothetical protein
MEIEEGRRFRGSRRTRERRGTQKNMTIWKGRGFSESGKLSKGAESMNRGELVECHGFWDTL